jgi:hypothetical protein
MGMTGIEGFPRDRFPYCKLNGLIPFQEELPWKQHQLNVEFNSKQASPPMDTVHSLLHG